MKDESKGKKENTFYFFFRKEAFEVLHVSVFVN